LPAIAVTQDNKTPAKTPGIALAPRNRTESDLHIAEL
jgi:hypothetical protein